MKKNREFHDNGSEMISCESELLFRCGTIYNVQSILMSLSPHRGCSAYSREALINLFVPDAALIPGRRLLTFLSQMRRLFEGGAYSSKYGNLSLNETSYVPCIWMSKCLTAIRWRPSMTRTRRKKP